jgi:hypothetical protein
MAEEIPHEVDIKTRANLAYLWSGALILFVGYILWQYGHILAVLTLIVGFITGTASTVLAVYFGAQITPKKLDGGSTVNVTGDQTIVPVNPQNPEQAV